MSSPMFLIKQTVVGARICFRLGFSLAINTVSPSLNVSKIEKYETVSRIIPSGILQLVEARQ